MKVRKLFINSLLLLISGEEIFFSWRLSTFFIFLCRFSPSHVFYFQFSFFRFVAKDYGKLSHSVFQLMMRGSCAPQSSRLKSRPVSVLPTRIAHDHEVLSRWESCSLCEPPGNSVYGWWGRNTPWGERCTDSSRTLFCPVCRQNCWQSFVYYLWASPACKQISFYHNSMLISLSIFFKFNNSSIYLHLIFLRELLPWLKKKILRV